jgi:hypothetical protein
MENDSAKAKHKKAGLKIWLISAGIGISLCAIVFLLIYTQYYHSFDSFLINISGRERMLSQKIAKELLLYKNDKSIIRSIGVSIYLFENTLLAIKNGGDVYSDLQLTQKRFIPASSDPILQKEIDAALVLWNKFKAEVDGYVDTEGTENLEEIILLNPVLLERLNSITLILQENAEWRHLLDNVFISFFIGLIIVMLLVYLRNRVVALRKATTIIEQLETILPICANCKKIREKSTESEEETWTSIEEYISRKDATKFTHGICPDCAKKLYPDLM